MAGQIENWENGWKIYGIKGFQIRHKAICLHLDHPRGYKTSESLKKNLEILCRSQKAQKSMDTLWHHKRGY